MEYGRFDGAPDYATQSRWMGIGALLLVGFGLLQILVGTIALKAAPSLNTHSVLFISGLVNLLIGVWTRASARALARMAPLSASAMQALEGKQLAELLDAASRLQRIYRLQIASTAVALVFGLVAGVIP
jgi:hypothetical protein